jgi:predicted RNA-binding protein
MSEYKITNLGYINENGKEVLDFHSHPTDKGKTSNLMTKGAGYFLSVIAGYLNKNKHRIDEFEFHNTTYEEDLLLMYLGFLNDSKYPILEDILKSGLELRTFVEQRISHVSALVNTLWMLDYKRLTPKLEYETINFGSILTYSRPEVLDINEKIYDEFVPKTKECVIIPCTSSRPYHKKKFKPTTAKLYKNKLILQEVIEDPSSDNIVITSIGLIPEDFWSEEAILKYDTGTRDLWQLLCNVKKFFTKYKFDKYYVYVGFKPYRDIMRVMCDMGVIDRDKIEFVSKDGGGAGGMQFYPKEYRLYKPNEDVK